MYQPEGFSLEIFKQRYAFTPEETWEQACTRVAKQMASVEESSKINKYEAKFHKELVNNTFVPGGRIWYNSGRPRPQLLNCFVLGDDLDSKEGWGNISREVIVTSMGGGGCGVSFDSVRPNGATISGHRGACPGPVELMKLVNGNGKPIRAGGVRRVALMFSLGITHPDLLAFLSAKLEDGDLELANISVKSEHTTKFIKTIEEDGDWELSWNGKYKKTVKAKEIWDIIVKNAYEKAEPGFLNWEFVESESTISYIEQLVTTNPCGEICMSSYDACCLGHLVLPRFVINGKVNWSGLADTIRTSVRFLDNALTVNVYPLKEMEAKTRNLRRIGLGTTGLADMLVIMGLKYGSVESIEFVDKLYRFISKAGYEASVMLAVEKGAFPACDPDQHVKTGFVKRMTSKVKSLIKDHGIRNCAILTQAPTGTVSILSGNCSSGIEPMFAPVYERSYWDKEVRRTELVVHPIFKEFMEAEADVSHFTDSKSLSVRDHLEMQKTIQKHVDNAVSKTINLPENYSIEDMSKVWLEYLPFLKGTTFYRENSRGYVDEQGNIHQPPLKGFTLEESKVKYKEAVVGSEVDCESGSCEI